VNLNEIVHEVIELTRPRWRDIPQRDGISIQIQSELEPKLPLLLSDPSELREALINLVFNAVDAMPQGGTITFVTRFFDVPDSDQDPNPKRHLLMEVKDTGAGMDEKVRQRCLEPFFSTKSLRGGTGLGLAMVYGMVQRHEGNIEIDSSPGRGTCIRLTFPLLEKPPQPVNHTSPRVTPGNSLRILCIDDEELMRQLLDDCLTHCNHQVVTAEDGMRGLELFRDAARGDRPFEVVITDLGMPKMDGTQLARIIKTEFPNTPIIMMTGWGAMIREDGETASEVDALVDKPPQMQELNDLLHRLTASDQRKT
jgi:CheY-like chemotaxis protein